MRKKKIIGLIGCGNIGKAILAQSAKRKIYNFIVCEKDRLKEAFIVRYYRVRIAKDIADLVCRSDVVIIAVKPQDIDMVLEEIRSGIQISGKTGILIISVAAGIKTEYIESKLSEEIRVVRAMPNMPARIGEGITAVVKGRFAIDKDLKVAANIFNSLGKTIFFNKEPLIDVVTALSGSGPAYMFFIVNALLTAAEGLGLDKKNANELIYHTIIGAMNLNKQENFDAGKLIAQVASKGGTTEAALKVFRKRRLGEIIIDAMIAAHKRAKELSR